MSLEQRFWRYAVVGMECWGWSGALHSFGYGTQTVVAQMFGVTQSSISDIHTGKAWAHV